jgi:hypothetical protein
VEHNLGPGVVEQGRNREWIGEVVLTSARDPQLADAAFAKQTTYGLAEKPGTASHQDALAGEVQPA